MEKQMTSNVWLPIAEYAIQNNVSISTLRRKIKSNAISYKMEEGRYLIGAESRMTPAPGPAPQAKLETLFTIHSTDAAVIETGQKQIHAGEATSSFDSAVNYMRWRAVEARVAGLVKKVEMLGEQVSELKMLVNIFEEKLDGRL